MSKSQKVTWQGQSFETTEEAAKALGITEQELESLFNKNKEKGKYAKRHLLSHMKESQKDK